MSQTYKYTVTGASHDPEVYYCRILVQKLQKYYELQSLNSDSWPVYVQLDFSVYLEVDYIAKFNELKALHGGKLYAYQDNHVVFCNEYCVGNCKDLIQLCLNTGIEDANIVAENTLNRYAREETQNLLLPYNRRCVYMDFGELIKKGSSISTVSYGKILVQLFDEVCPMACDSFYSLCVPPTAKIPNTEIALNYTGSQVTRIVKGGWFQCGDIVDGSGRNSIAATASGSIPDESFSVDFNCQTGGIVGYTSSEPHSNGSQFHITLGPCEWMNNKYVGVGRVIFGYKVLKTIEEIQVSNQKPVLNVYVESCGKFL